MKPEKMVSPSRTYVAICNNSNWDGVYFRKFTLPDSIPDEDPLAPEEGVVAKNNAEFASWYFLNRVDFVSCIEGVITFEDYCNIAEVDAVSSRARQLRVQVRDPEVERKAGLYSEFHKSLHGYRPLNNCLSDEERAKKYDELLAEFDRMKATPEGRAELRSRGFEIDAMPPPATAV